MKPQTLFPHPSPHPVLSQVKSLGGVMIHPPPTPALRNQAARGPRELDSLTYEAANFLLSIDLPSFLESAGAHAYPWDTERYKYGRRKIFVFEYAGETLACICEQGDGGNEWCWFPKKDRPNRTLSPEDARVVHFWPDFIVDIMAACGQPLSRVDLCFSQNAPPNVRRLAQSMDNAIEEKGLRPSSPRRL